MLRATFVDQPIDAKALRILDVVTTASKSSHRRIAISSRYSPGFSRRYCFKASSMGGAMLRRRLEPLEGALVVPKHHRFERMALIDRLLQLATSAI